MHPTTIHVLLVEDSVADVELLRYRLRKASSASRTFQLTVANSLGEALARLSHPPADAIAELEKLRREPFHVVLLDLVLPDSDGMDTLRQFLASDPLVPVIVLTGITDEDLAVEAVNAGAQDFLFKDHLDERILRRSIRYSIERHRLEQEQRQLSAQLLSAIGDEQQRIALELHDEVGQSLAGLNMMTQSLARKLRLAEHAEADRARLVSEGIQDVLDSFRRVLCGLSPVDIDDQGLAVALQRLCENVDAAGVRCEFDGQPRLSVEDNAMAWQLYRIAQESLSNAMRHAKAQHLRVKLRRRDRWIALSIIDDGIGFDSDQEAYRGRGLRILRHRSELIGGSLSIHSNASGTTVTCEVEVQRDGTKDNS